MEDITKMFLGGTKRKKTSGLDPMTILNGTKQSKPSKMNNKTIFGDNYKPKQILNTKSLIYGVKNSPTKHKNNLSSLMITPNIAPRINRKPLAEISSYVLSGKKNSNIKGFMISMNTKPNPRNKNSNIKGLMVSMNTKPSNLINRKPTKSKYPGDNILNDMITSNQKRFLTQSKGFKKNRFMDTDKDGVIDGLDCYRLDPNQHGFFTKAKNFLMTKGYKENEVVQKEKELREIQASEPLEKQKFEKQQMLKARLLERQKADLLGRKNQAEQEIKQKYQVTIDSTEERLGELEVMKKDLSDQEYKDKKSKIKTKLYYAKKAKQEQNDELKEVKQELEKIPLKKEFKQWRDIGMRNIQSTKYGQAIQKTREIEAAKAKPSEGIIENLGGFIGEKVSAAVTNTKQGLGRATGYAFSTKEDREDFKKKDMGIGAKIKRNEETGEMNITGFAPDIAARIIAAKKRLTPDQIKKLDNSLIQERIYRDKNGYIKNKTTSGSLSAAEYAREVFRLAKTNPQEKALIEERISSERAREGLTQLRRSIPLQRQQENQQMGYLRYQQELSKVNTADLQARKAQQGYSIDPTRNLKYLSNPREGVYRAQPRMFINNMMNDETPGRDGYLDALDVQGFTRRSNQEQRYE